ncbi:HIT domain-containing protein [Candidatus Woesearchaeota archaeon]|nr:HIT domain-containing protein [Candidatus Woesearchaeota archaeon]
MPEQPSPEQMQALQEKVKNMSPEELKEFQKKQCIFCKIVAGDINSKKVYEDEKCTAILDINPANPGHILLIPKEHFPLMPLMPNDLVDHLFLVAKEISRVMLTAVSADGVSIFVANGSAAGQRAQHFMIHIIPRKTGDKIKLDIPVKEHPQEDIDNAVEKIQEKIDSVFKTKKKIVRKKPEKKKTSGKKGKKKTSKKKKPRSSSKKPKKKKTKKKSTKKKSKEESGVSLDDIADIIG